MLNWDIIYFPTLFINATKVVKTQLHQNTFSGFPSLSTLDKLFLEL